MHDRELFEKAFSPLHASPDTLTEVRKTMRNEKKTRRALGKGAVIAIAAALTLTIAVAGGIVTLITADVSPADKVDDTTHHAFTDDIDSSSPDFVEDGKGGYVSVADMERIPGDAATTQRLVGKYLSKLDAELTVAGSTYKMGTFLVDETGSGILTFSVENPEGFDCGDMGYGETWIRNINVDLNYGHSEPTDPNGQDHGYAGTDMKLYVDETASTDTCLQVIAYFISGKGYEKGTGFFFTVRDASGQPYSISIQPRTYLPVKTFTAENGQQMFLSPLGLTMVDTLYVDDEILIDEILVRYQDGSDYAVDSAEHNLRNWVVGLITGRGDTDEYLRIELGITDPPEGSYYSYLFNRLVDVDTVTSVDLVGRYLNADTNCGEVQEHIYQP